MPEAAADDLAVPDTVMTVLGPVRASDLGITMCHEHVFIDLWREFSRDGMLDEFELAVSELGRLVAAGGRTLVDLSNNDLGRDPQKLMKISRRTGLQIVMSAGHYREPFLDREYFDRNDADAIAADLVRDLLEGVGPDGVRAGIIGEIGSERNWITPAEERSFRAAGRAHLQTGVAVTTHASPGNVGLRQLDLLVAEGVSPARVVIGHCDVVPDPGYHLEVARRGAYVQFDTIRERNDYELTCRENYVTAMLEHGYADQVLLSQDICNRRHLDARGGGGYGFLLSEFVPRLRARGVSEAELETILVANPRRVLTPGF